MSDRIYWAGLKGFIRVFEMVLFAFLIFGILLPNFFRYNDPNDWSSVKSRMLSNDILFAFEKSGMIDNALDIDPRNGEEVSSYHEKSIEIIRNATEKVFPVTYDFEYEIKNAPPPFISIGCVCDDAQMQWLENNLLTPSYPTFLFALKKTELGNFSDKLDTFVIFGQKDLSPYMKDITSLMQKGKGFVLISDFDSAPDSLTRDMFDINYAGGGSSQVSMGFSSSNRTFALEISKRYIHNLIRVDTQGGSFMGTLYLRGNSYDLQQNQSGNCLVISSCSPCLHENETCIIPGVAQIFLYQRDQYNSGWVDLRISSVADNPRNYTFEDLAPLSVRQNASTVVGEGQFAFANAVVGGYSASYETESRRFWIYDYNKTRTDLNLLLKTGLIWSSGEHYFMFNKVVPEKRIRATHFFTSLGDSNIPYMVNLYTWGY